MSIPFSCYQESAAALSAPLEGRQPPEILLVLGSGLGSLGDEVANALVIPYRDIPHFPISTAPGHKGQLVMGTLEGKSVAVMQGRMHYYEGYSLEEAVYPLRVLRLLGVRTLLITNASGCIRTDWQAGELMLITDQIKFALDSPLRGENLPEFGPRFPDSSHLYTPRLQAVARQAAQDAGIVPLREGVYMYFTGPQYETPAEIRAARLLGADAAGMSTAPEVIAAAHCGMEVLGFSLLSNMAAGILDQPLSEEEVLLAGENGREQFSALVRGCLRLM